MYRGAYTHVVVCESDNKRSVGVVGVAFSACLSLFHLGVAITLTKSVSMVQVIFADYFYSK